MPNSKHNMPPSDDESPTLYDPGSDYWEEEDEEDLSSDNEKGPAITAPKPEENPSYQVSSESEQEISCAEKGSKVDAEQKQHIVLSYLRNNIEKLSQEIDRYKKDSKIDKEQKQRILLDLARKLVAWQHLEEKLLGPETQSVSGTQPYLPQNLTDRDLTQYTGSYRAYVGNNKAALKYTGSEYFPMPEIREYAGFYNKLNNPAPFHEAASSFKTYSRRLFAITLAAVAAMYIAVPFAFAAQIGLQIFVGGAYVIASLALIKAVYRLRLPGDLPKFEDAKNGIENAQIISLFIIFAYGNLKHLTQDELQEIGEKVCAANRKLEKLNIGYKSAIVQYAISEGGNKAFKVIDYLACEDAVNIEARFMAMQPDNIYEKLKWAIYPRSKVRKICQKIAEGSIKSSNSYKGLYEDRIEDSQEHYIAKKALSNLEALSTKEANYIVRYISSKDHKTSKYMIQSLAGDKAKFQIYKQKDDNFSSRACWYVYPGLLWLFFDKYIMRSALEHMAQEERKNNTTPHTVPLQGADSSVNSRVVSPAIHAQKEIEQSDNQRTIS